MDGTQRNILIIDISWKWGKMKFKTYHKIIFPEGRNKDEYNTKGSIEKALNIHSFPIFLCHQEFSVNMCAAWHVGWGPMFALTTSGTNSPQVKGQVLSFCHLLSMSFITNNVIVYNDQIKENTQIWAALENFTVYDIKIGMSVYRCCFFSWHVVELLVSIPSWMDESFDRF